jgi:hypothetical protein
MIKTAESMVPFTKLCASKEDLASIKAVIDGQPGLWIIKPGENSNRGKGIIL